MNVERIKAAIELMQNAKALDMRSWQDGTVAVAYDIDTLHSCGNTACFAGYLALSKEWKEAGFFFWLCPKGYSDAGGELTGSDAVAAYLEISTELAYSLVHGELSFEGDDDAVEYSDFYDKLWHEVKPEDVIAKLEMILSGELR